MIINSARKDADRGSTERMDVIIMTQETPFFLAENLDYLFSSLSSDINISACVLFEASPFEKNDHLPGKIFKTWQIFGTGFLLNYGTRYIANKFKKEKQVSHVLKKHSIPIIKLSKSINASSSLSKIQSFHPDLLISIAGNQIYKQELLNIAPKGCLNLHTALLPKYRGLMPTFWVLKNQEKETGVSVFLVDDGIDSGPILVQKRIPINGISHRKLIKKTKKIGMDAVIEAVNQVNRGQYQLIPNNDDKSTYFSFPTREDVRIFKERGKRFY